MMAYLQENDSVNMPFWIKKKERLGKRMYRKKSRGWYKHKDFILIDLACLFMALILAYLIRNGSVRNLFTLGIYRNVMIFVILVDLFLIILFVFKSISLPFILLFVIEFAIFVNMAIPYYQGVTLPFVASIVIGAIQLGATVDYAILMTSNYQKQRHLGKTKKESISIAHKFSMKSIIVSGCSFFAATFGVALYSKVDMIGAICTLLARGAVISTVVVLLILPAMFMVFDPLIVHTSKGFLPDKK